MCTGLYICIHFKLAKYTRTCGLILVWRQEVAALTCDFYESRFVWWIFVKKKDWSKLSTNLNFRLIFSDLNTFRCTVTNTWFAHKHDYVFLTLYRRNYLMNFVKLECKYLLWLWIWVIFTDLLNLKGNYYLFLVLFFVMYNLKMLIFNMCF